MSRRTAPDGNLIYAAHDGLWRHTVLLTLAVILGFISRPCHADMYTDNEYSGEQRQRITDAEAYLRKQGLHGVSLLPGEVRQALGWFSGSWHAVPLATLQSEDTPAEPLAGNTAAQAAPHPEDGESFMGGVPVNLASNFHHKGFLPTRDAMVMGIAFGKNIAGDKLQFAARPFYGQNWLAIQGYWGMEVSMTIVQRDDGQPWGKIGVTYTGGNEKLTDQGRGANLHGDVDLTRGFHLNAGMRQSDFSSDDNYVMLRWRLNFN